MLITPDAPLVVEDERVVFGANKIDFFKPDLKQEYPLVNSDSQACYLSALDACFLEMARRCAGKVCLILFCLSFSLISFSFSLPSLLYSLFISTLIP